MRPDVVRVVVADDVTFTRDLLRCALEDGGCCVVGEASTGRSLLDTCVAHAPQVVVTDIDLADGPIERWLPAVAGTGAQILIFCEDPSPERLTGALLEHAAGYLLRDSPPTQVVDGALAVAAGGAVLAPAAATAILGQWRRLRRDPLSHRRRSTELTGREHDVLDAMVDGLATKAIAARLGVAVKTVENHKLRVFDKLGVRTHAQAVSVAIADGLTRTQSPGRVEVER